MAAQQGGRGRSSALDGLQQPAHLIDALAPVALLTAPYGDLGRPGQQKPHHVVVLGVVIGPSLKVVKPRKCPIDVGQRLVGIVSAVAADVAQAHGRAAHVLEQAINVGVGRLNGGQWQHCPVQVDALHQTSDLLEPEPAVDGHRQCLAPGSQAAEKPLLVEGVELDARLHLIQRCELRVEPGLNRALAKQAYAEGVDGLDVRTVQVAKCHLDALRVWRLAALGQVFKSLAHPAHQLGCRVLRKRDDGHVVNVNGLPTHRAGGEHGRHPRHHRGGLAGAGARLDTQVLSNGNGDARAGVVIDDAHAMSRSSR